MTTPGIGTGGTAGAAVFTAAANFAPLIAESRGAAESLTGLRGGLRETSVALDQTEKAATTVGRTMAGLRTATAETAAGNSRLATSSLEVAGALDKVAAAAAKYGDALALIRRAQSEAGAGTDRLVSQNAQLDRSLSAIGKSGVAARDGLVQVEGSANSAREAMAVVGAQADRTAAQLRAVGTAAAEESRGVAAMGAGNQAAQRELAATGAASTTMGRDVAAGSAVAGSGVRTTGAAAAEAESKATSLGSKFSQVGKGMSDTGGMLISKVQNPLLATGAAAYVTIKAYSSYQTALTQLGTEAGMTQGEIKQVGDQFLTMGSQTGQSADVLAKSFFSIQSAMGATLDPATRVQTEMDVLSAAAKGAAIDNSSMADTTNALVGVMTSNLIPGANNAGDAMSKMIAVVGTGNAHLIDFVHALKSGLTPEMATLGVSFADAGAIMARWADLGTPMEMTGNRLKTMVGQLVKPSKEGAAALNGIGMSGTQLAEDIHSHGLLFALQDLRTNLDKTFPTGSGHAISFAEQQKALTDFDQALKDTNVTGQAAADSRKKFVAELDKSGSAAVMREQALLAIGGKSRGGAFLVGTVNQLDAEQTKADLINKSGPQVLDEAMAKRAQDVGQKFKDAKAEMHNAAIVIGADLAPAFTKLAAILDKTAQFLSRHPALVKALAYALGATLVAAVVGGALGAFLKFGAGIFKVGELAGKTIGTIGRLAARMAGLSRLKNGIGLLEETGKVSKGQSAFDRAMAETGGVSKKEVQVSEKGAGAVEGKLARLGRLVARPFKAVWNFASSGASAVEGAVVKLAKLVARPFIAVYRMLMAGADAVASGIARLGGLAAKGGRAVFRASLTGAEAVGSGLKRIGSAALDAGKAGAKAALDLGKLAAGGIAAGIGKLGTAFMAFGRSAVGAIRAVGAAMLANPWILVLMAVIAVIILVITHWKQFKEAVVAVWHFLLDAAKTVWKAITDAVSAAVSWVVDFVKKHWDLLLGIVMGPLGLILGFVIKHWDDIKRIVGDAIAWVGNKLQQGWDAIKNAVSAAWNAVGDFIRGAWDKIKQIVSDALNAVGNFLSTRLDNIKQNFSNAWDGFRNIVSDVWNAITGAVSGAVNSVIGFIDNVIGKIQGAINWVGNLASKIGSLPGKALSFIGLAAGGPVPGSGVGDTTPAMLTPGEHVLTTSDVHNLGGHAGVMALRTAVSGGAAAHGDGRGGFATGGTLGGINSQIGSVLAQIKIAELRGGVTDRLRAELSALLAERNTVSGSGHAGRHSTGHHRVAGAAHHPAHHPGHHPAAHHPGTATHHRGTAAHHKAVAAHHKAVTGHLRAIRTHTSTTAKHTGKTGANPALLGYLEATAQANMRQLGYAGYADAQRGLGLKVTGSDNSATWQALKRAASGQGAGGSGGGGSSSGMSTTDNLLTRIATYCQAIVTAMHMHGAAQNLLAGTTPLGGQTIGSGGGIANYGVQALGVSPWMGGSGLAAFAHSGTTITGPVTSTINVTTNVNNPVPQTAAETNAATMQRIAALGLIPGA